MTRNFNPLMSISNFALERSREAADLSAIIGQSSTGFLAPNLGGMGSPQAQPNRDTQPQIPMSGGPTAGPVPSQPSVAPMGAAPNVGGLGNGFLAPNLGGMGSPQFASLDRQPQIPMSGGPTAGLTPAQPSAAPMGATPNVGGLGSGFLAPNSVRTPSQPNNRDKSIARLLQNESGGNFRATNSSVGAGDHVGHFGRAQFGVARLEDIKRAGVLPSDMTIEQFLENPEAQKAAEIWHFKDLDRAFMDSGLAGMAERGETVNGMPVTVDAHRNVAHLGGKAGAKRYFESKGEYNPTDDNGTSLSDYHAMALGPGFAKTEDPIADVAAALGSDVAPTGATEEQRKSIEETLGSVFEDLANERGPQTFGERFSRDNFDLGGLIEGLGKGFSQLGAGQAVDLSSVAARQDQRMAIKYQERKELNQRRAAASVAAEQGDTAMAEAILRGGINYGDYLTTRQIRTAEQKAATEEARIAQQNGNLARYMAKNGFSQEDIEFVSGGGDFSAVMTTRKIAEANEDLLRENLKTENRITANLAVAERWLESANPNQKEAAEIWFAQGGPDNSETSVFDIFNNLGGTTTREAKLQDTMKARGVDRDTAVQLIDKAPDPTQKAAEDKINRLMELPEIAALPENQRRAEAIRIVDLYDMSPQGLIRRDSGTLVNTPGGNTESAGLYNPPLKSLFESANDITGAIPAFRRTASGIFGQVSPSFSDADAVQAVKGMDLAMRSLVQALALNPRFPVGEMEMIERSFGFNTGLFTSPSDLQNEMVVIDSFMRGIAKRQRDISNDKTRSPEERSNAEASARYLEEFVTDILQVPPDRQSILGEVPVISSPEDLANLSQGAVVRTRPVNGGEGRFIIMTPNGPRAATEQQAREYLSKRSN